MNRRNLLKTFLAAPAIIRSGVLMPVVPLAFDDRALLHWNLKARSWWIDSDGRAEFSGLVVRGATTVDVQANGGINCVPRGFVAHQGGQLVMVASHLRLLGA